MQPGRGALGQQEGVCGVAEQCTLAVAILPSIMSRYAESQAMVTWLSGLYI